MRKITNKAKEIYGATKSDCRKHVKTWGYNPEVDGGFTGVSTEECVYARVINDMKALLNSDMNTLRINTKLGIIEDEKAEFEFKILTMMERTINNQYVSKC